MAIEITHSNMMDVFQLPAGRRAYALAAVLAAAKKAKVELGDAAKAAVAANEACRAREKAWDASGATGKSVGGECQAPAHRCARRQVRQRDPRHSSRQSWRTWTRTRILRRPIASVSVSTATSRTAPPRTPSSRTSRSMLPSPTLVADLRKEHADLVKLLGLERRLTRLSALLPKYKTEIDASNAGATITYKDVVLAREAAHEAMCALIAVVAGRWWRPEDAATRASLLGPILQQSEKVAEARRGRREVEDIDPETGDPVAPSAPAVPAPPA
jgi:hypothetical protein